MPRRFSGLGKFTPEYLLEYPSDYPVNTFLKYTGFGGPPISIIRSFPDNLLGMEFPIRKYSTVPRTSVSEEKTFGIRTAYVCCTRYTRLGTYVPF